MEASSTHLAQGDSPAKPALGGRRDLTHWKREIRLTLEEVFKDLGCSFSDDEASSTALQALLGLRAKLLAGERPEEERTQVIGQLADSIFVEVKNTLAEIQTAQFKAETDFVLLQNYFEFAKECLQAQFIKSIHLTILFEQAFTTAAASDIERLFDLFTNFINVNGLYNAETSKSDPESNGNDLVLFRMFEHSILSKIQPFQDSRLQGKAIALLASLVLFNHQGVLNVLGKFNDRKEGEDVMTQEEAEQSLVSESAYLNRRAAEQGLSIPAPALDLEQFRKYKNFWRLADFLQSPHAIFSTREPICFEPLKLEPLTPAPRRTDSRKDKGKVKKVEEDVESGEIVDAGLAIVENLDVHYIRRQVEHRSPSSLLMEVLFQIEAVMNRYKNGPVSRETDAKWSLQSHLNKATSPSKQFNLFGLQEQDYFFKQRFTMQSLIFIECLLLPIKDQVEKFKIPGDPLSAEMIQNLEHLKQRGLALIRYLERQMVPCHSFTAAVKQGDDEQKKKTNLFDTATGLASTLKRERFWANSKQKKFNNYFINGEENSVKKFAKKRTLKQKPPKRLVKSVGTFNRFRGGADYFRESQMAEEKYEPGMKRLKQCSHKQLNEYLNPLLADQDPAQLVEDEFKKKNDIVFTWKFLRATQGYYEQDYNFLKHIPDPSYPELLAAKIHSMNPKRPIIEKKEEEATDEEVHLKQPENFEQTEQPEKTDHQMEDEHEHKENGEVRPEVLNATVPCGQ